MSYIPSIISDNYQFWPTVYLATAFALGMGLLQLAGKLIPIVHQTQKLNQTVADKRMQREYYRQNQGQTKFWGGVAQVLTFVLVIPFCVTPDSHPWWNIALDVFIILMVYDFVYYLTHRFLFHDGPLGGPLLHIHAIHHQNKNPCRMDSSYLHPLESIIGLALFIGSIAVLAVFMGKFSVITLLIAHVAFLAVNLHNHDLVEESPRFPFRYWHHAAHMHHVHHSRFTSGNFATITLFYDWLFGTYDKGEGYQKRESRPKKESERA